MAYKTSPAGGIATAPAQPSPQTTAPTARRLVGVDLARGLAVLGMFTVHAGPEPAATGALAPLVEATYGRSSALFALLAGFTLVLMTGRPEPRTGRPGRQAVARVLIRAAVLFVLGVALVAFGTQVDVILAYYALLFVFVLPFYRLRAASLAVAAAATALVLPQVLYLVKLAIDGGSWSDTLIAADPLAGLTDSDGVLDLLFTGPYPVLTWIPFLLAGMAVAKLDLSQAVVRARLALTGVGLAVLGYGGSWLALHLVPGAYAAVAANTDGDSPSSAWWSETVGEPTDNFREWLLVGAPHSQTTPSIVGATGVALAVLAGCLVAVDRLPRFRRLATPVTAVGMVSLSAYVLHIVAIRAVWKEDLPGSWAELFLFFAATMLFAVVWTRLFRRGPLEYVLHTAAKPARFIR
ncbi:DUF418 domain-containing protein [Streptomyces purpurogeneiscleroticus]|uniref:DUF418 domain-containing protein n=1 Tax=Streptomyces purpurogeneiscleroticus TaxID=68259 RepID=UPI001CC13802|nr:DUF418 domain-containing protein [Streptomyces purpurogeneiscleroticus]MBZ4018780.1 hypothetical protein [Streptomyces purpurogeneiscleroticus]